MAVENNHDIVKVMRCNSLLDQLVYTTKRPTFQQQISQSQTLCTSISQLLRQLSSRKNTLQTLCVRFTFSMLSHLLLHLTIGIQLSRRFTKSFSSWGQHRGMAPAMSKGRHVTSRSSSKTTGIQQLRASEKIRDRINLHSARVLLTFSPTVESSSDLGSESV